MSLEDSNRRLMELGTRIMSGFHKSLGGERLRLSDYEKRQMVNHWENSEEKNPEHYKVVRGKDELPIEIGTSNDKLAFKVEGVVIESSETKIEEAVKDLLSKGHVSSEYNKISWADISTWAGKLVVLIGINK